MKEEYLDVDVFWCDDCQILLTKGADNSTHVLDLYSEQDYCQICGSELTYLRSFTKSQINGFVSYVRDFVHMIIEMTCPMGKEEMHETSRIMHDALVKVAEIAYPEAKESNVNISDERR